MLYWEIYRYRGWLLLLKRRMLCFLWGPIIVNLWFFSKENFENWLLWYSRSLNQTMVLSGFFLFALEGFSSKIGGSLLEFAWKSYFNYFKCLFSTKYYQNKIFWLGKIDILCAKKWKNKIHLDDKIDLIKLFHMKV